MRRNDREFTDPESMLELLSRCQVGRLGTVGSDGRPRIKPVNFVALDNFIYFHTALEGEKIDDIKRDGRVCFEVDLPIAYVASGNKACSAGYLYRSVMIQGNASLVDDPQEKIGALDGLMQKHEGADKPFHYGRAALEETGIVRIAIEQMTGKESLGQGKAREAALEALDTGAPLPIVIKPE
ncbi:MAG: pyridoxamine 5'-phosphate oxidase family protein [candidate division Zixibacteria bacterium]|nr:pyridoxamine 5'-phosphate oxidase family protein [candidate division Zixibacteria bacterium]MDH3937193.1 pyridoxamine 5'-phosphate oxidase family protein [candidate division Zixibacteria bacterium]MDH4032456.1 pyridoxamine 5'-phosphate oxidase family protein [candidate division Zixibacteria bacterium]